MKLFDDENDQPMMQFEFNYRDLDDNPDFGSRIIDTRFRINDAASWDQVLTNFLDFLGSVYGYDLKEQVDYKGNPCTTPASACDSEWPFDTETTQDSLEGSGDND